MLVAALAATLMHAQTASKSSPGPTLSEAARLTNTGHGIEALKQLDALAAVRPHAPGLERARGQALYSLDRLREAEAAFAAAMADDAKDLESTQMRGLTLFRLGRPADAIPLLESAPGGGLQAKADPSYLLALCYMDTRRYDDARHAFAAQYGLQPDSAAGYLLAARMLHRREYLPVAQRFAARALELDPQLPLANELLGEIALAQNHLEDAAGYFEKERGRNPLDPNAYERLGDVYSRGGRYAEARRALQQAILLEPYATGPYILLGKVTLKEGDAVAALTYLQKAEHMDPANFMTHNLLAQTYRSLGRGEDAARELQLTEKLQSATAPKLTPVQ
jgi:predicted Zn-dependent protease